jgi:predicted transcriptional regulator
MGKARTPASLEAVMTTLETSLVQPTVEGLIGRNVMVISQHMSLEALAHLMAQAKVSGAPWLMTKGAASAS